MLFSYSHTYTQLAVYLTAYYRSWAAARPLSVKRSQMLLRRGSHSTKPARANSAAHS